MVVFFCRAGTPAGPGPGVKDCFRTLHDAAPITIAHPTRNSKLLFWNFDMLDVRSRRTAGKPQTQRLPRRNLFRRTHDLAITFLDDAVAALHHRLRIEMSQIGLHFTEPPLILLEHARLATLQTQS